MLVVLNCDRSMYMLEESSIRAVTAPYRLSPVARADVVMSA